MHRDRGDRWLRIREMNCVNGDEKALITQGYTAENCCYQLTDINVCLLQDMRRARRSTEGSGASNSPGTSPVPRVSFDRNAAPGMLVVILLSHDYRFFLLART